MPVTKYRSIEAMPDTTWHKPGAPELFLAMRHVWAFSARAFPRTLPPGVHKHRSIEEAHDQEAEWERADQDRLRSTRA